MPQDPVGALIRYFRNRANISQLEFELQLNMSSGSISRIESGRVNPTKETLKKIIHILSLTEYESAEFFGIHINHPLGTVTAKDKSFFAFAAHIVVNRIPEVGYNSDIISAVLYNYNQEKTAFSYQCISSIQRLFDAMERIYPPNRLQNRIVSLSQTTIMKDCFKEKITVAGSTLKSVVGDQLSEKEDGEMCRMIGFKSFIACPVDVGENDKAVLHVEFSKPIQELSSADYNFVSMYCEKTGNMLAKAKECTNAILNFKNISNIELE